MKLKVTCLEGKYNFYMSYIDPFPNQDISLIDFPVSQELLYKFYQPKLHHNWCFFAIKVKVLAKIEIKCWFTGFN